MSQLRLLQEQPQVVKDIASPYVATGAWFAHPEAVLLSLMCSSDREERELGVEKISPVPALYWPLLLAGGQYSEEYNEERRSSKSTRESFLSQMK